MIYERRMYKDESYKRRMYKNKGYCYERHEYKIKNIFFIL